ncbi:translation initiation factor IF-2 [Patescibacteria group bacterium]
MTKEKENLITRPPVVVVLGHVDHGKSSILEAIKDLKITEKEAGGITQHIGAYEVEHQGKKITFIDTPGHEAFSQMRSRGAKVADIAILVVAAEEGIKVQTKEAISHIKKAGIPIIVAINKMDKPEANPEKIKKQLEKEDILVEKLGGKIPSIELSAKTSKGISDLLEIILLVAEMENLKGDISKDAQGVVIEAYLDTLRGPIATLLLQNGILKKGDIVGTFSAVGKIKNLEDFQGASIEKTLPSMPVIVLGFENVPKIGERFKVFSDVEFAKSYLQEKEKLLPRSPEVILAEEGKKVLNLIIKVDVLGSLEAIEGVLKNLPQEKVLLRILKSEVGEVNESDLKLAKGAKAKILAFRVKTKKNIQELAERQKIRIITFDIIYELVEGARTLMEKSLTPEIVRQDLGKFKTLVDFWAEKNRQIVGGKVIEGEVTKGTKIEIFRGEEKIGKGKLVNLQINKKDVDRVAKGQECGILYEGEEKIEQGDTLVIYQEAREKKEL